MSFWKKGRRKWIALTMALVMAFTAISWDMLRKEAKAKETKKTESEFSEEELFNYLELLESSNEVIELKNERTKDSTTYSYGNGLKKVVYYSDDVRYENAKGELVDYDYSLTDVGNSRGGSGYKYENSNGDNKNSLPSNIASKPVLMESKDYSIELAPVLIDQSTENEFNNVEGMGTATAITESYTDIYDKETKSVVGARYTSKDKSMELEYITSDKGIKENIVLNAKPESNVWKFKIELGDLEPELNEQSGNIDILDGGKKVAVIEKAFMNDATNAAYSEDISYEISRIGKSSEYELTMTVSKDYLNSADRVYPVTIDPTITWTGSSNMDDVYVLNGAQYKDTNFYSDAVKVLAVGDSKQGVYRTYVNIAKLITKVKGFSIASAKLTLYETSGSAKGQVVEAYRVKEAYDKKTITWNNRASYDNTKALASIVSTGKSGKASSFDMTSHVRNLAKEKYPNHGIMLKAKNDDKASKYTSFYSARNASAAYRPRLEVVYYEKPTKPTSVTLNKRYIKPGETLNISWEGIVSQELSMVQYRLTTYSLDTKEEIKNIIAYSNDTKLGSAISGSSVVADSKNWKDEGEYKLVVRGYDKFKNAGDGKGVSFVIDGTKPTLGSASLDVESNKDNYSSKLPIISWSGASDKYLKAVEYSVNDSDYTVMGKTTDGSYTLPQGVINNAGEYKIKVRAIDKAGNTSEEKELVFYYDGGKPVVDTFTTVPVEKGSVATPMIVWNVEDESIATVKCSINDGESFEVGKTATGSYVIEEGKITGEGIYKISLTATDMASNVSDKKEINYTYDKSITSSEVVTVVPGTSSDSYTSVAPTIVATSLEDTKSATISYKLSLNGDVLEEKSEKVDVISGIAAYKIDSKIFHKSGDYNLEVKVTDENNVEKTNVTTVYKYDAIAPELKSARVINTSFDKAPTVEIKGISDDKAGVSNKVAYMVVPVQTDTKDIKTLAYEATANVNDKNLTFNLDASVTNALAEDVYKILVGIKDTAGNMSKIEELGYYRFNAKYDGKEAITAKFNEETNNIDIAWSENENIKESKLYARYGNKHFNLVDTITETNAISVSVKDVETTVGYRVVHTYTDGSKKVSNIVTLEKTEESDEESEDAADDDEDSEESSGTTSKITYEESMSDKDEDGLDDGYELWDFSSCIDVKDTDGDKFDDYYEVSTLGTSPASYTEDGDSDKDGLYNLKEYALGTDPYLADSDFDGIGDASDREPTKTDTKSGATPKYTTDIHVGPNDRQTEEVVDGIKVITIENIYTGKLKQVNEDGEITAYFYDSDDNNTAVIGYIDGEYIVNTYTYDKESNLTYLTHNGFGYAFNYDNEGNMTDILAANRSLVNYKYKKVAADVESEDEEDSYVQSSVIYANNYRYDYEYDETNENITSIKIDNKLAYTMSYDENGNMTKQEDKINNITYTYEYEGEDIKSIKTSDGFTINYVNNKSETVTEGEDKFNKSTYGTGYIDGDKTRVKQTTVTENSEDKITNSTTLLINKDTVEQIVNENDNTQTTTVKNSEGNTLIHSTVIENEDGTSEIRNITGESIVYKYDKNENIISITNGEDDVVTYEYDAIEQVTRENDSKAGTTTLFTYDKGGNITTKKVYNYTTGEVTGTPIKVNTYSYDDSEWRDLLTSYNGQAITYDEIGNPLQYRDGYNFTWTNGRSLKSVKKAGVETSYKYNQNGYRTSKTVNGKTTNYTLEEMSIVKEETEGQTIWYIYDGDGELIGFELNGTSYYYNKNLQGDIIGIVDSKGAEIATYRYDAWGSVIAIEGNEEIAKQNPFRYRGYYYDEEIGMYYLNSRYYDAEVGRFINADDVNLIPLIQSGVKGANLFEYCNNNAVNREDPSGYASKKKKESIREIVIGAVAGFAGSLWGWLQGKAYDRLWEALKENVISKVAPKVKAVLGKFISNIKKMSLNAFKKVVRSTINGFKYVVKGLKWAWKFHKKAIVIAGFTTILVGTFVATAIKCS